MLVVDGSYRKVEEREREVWTGQSSHRPGSASSEGTWLAQSGTVPVLSACQLLVSTYLGSVCCGSGRRVHPSVHGGQVAGDSRQRRLDGE